MAKIPSRKFSTDKKKIPSRPFPKSKTKISSKPFAKGTAQPASRKLFQAPAAASQKPDAPILPDRPAKKTTRQERLTTLQRKVTPASNLASPVVDSPAFDSKPLAMQTEVFTSPRFNLLTDIPLHLPNELITTLLEAANLRIERIVSHGHASPDGFWYDQDEHEWVVVLQGAGRLMFEDETVAMKPGDCLNIPARKKHRVEWTTPDEPTIWLAVFHG
jgi:cupin 2 domain-containing protein